jgi:hypothetical protein
MTVLKAIIANSHKVACRCGILSFTVREWMERYTRQPLSNLKKAA